MDYGQDWIGDVEIVNEKLRRESWYNTRWAKFAGFVDISEDENGQPMYTASGNPIEILDDHVQQGRDNMLIPFLNELTGPPVYGDAPVEGTGEELGQRYLYSFVNQWRKAAMKRTGKMAELRAKMYKLYDQARPQLQRYVAKYENQEVYRAFYEGGSRNLTMSTAMEGLGMYKRYNPNFYYISNATTGALTHVAGTERTTPSAANLNSAVTAVSGNTLSVAALRQLRMQMMYLRVPPLETMDGDEYWPLIVHPKQLTDLKGDANYREPHRIAWEGLRRNPELTGLAAWTEGFAIFEDLVGIRNWDDATGGFYGDDEASPIETVFSPAPLSADNYCAVVYGRSAIGKGIGRRLGFTNVERDHGNAIEIAVNQINGYNRADFALEEIAGKSGAGQAFQTGTTGGVSDGLELYNDSSLILMTN